MNLKPSAFKNSVILLCLFTSTLQTATAQTVSLSIKDVTQKVQNNLPQLQVLREQAKASEQNIALTKNTYIPDLNAGYQVNVATYNNITGLSYPGFLLPISGPPSQSNKMTFVTGSALGVLAKWNPFTFGQRNAAIETATAQFKKLVLLITNSCFNISIAQLIYTLKRFIARRF